MSQLKFISEVYLAYFFIGEDVIGAISDPVRSVFRFPNSVIFAVSHGSRIPASSHVFTDPAQIWLTSRLNPETIF